MNIAYLNKSCSTRLGACTRLLPPHRFFFRIRMRLCDERLVGRCVELVANGVGHLQCGLHSTIVCCTTIVDKVPQGLRSTGMFVEYNNRIFYPILLFQFLLYNITVDKTDRLTDGSDMESAESTFRDALHHPNLVGRIRSQVNGSSACM